MAGVEERLAHVDGRVEGQAQMLTDIGGRLIALDQKFDRKFAELDAKFDQKFAELDAKFDRKFAELDAKFERRFAELYAKFERAFGELHREMASNFRWIVGIQFTTLVALLASLIAG